MNKRLARELTGTLRSTPLARLPVGRSCGHIWATSNQILGILRL